MGCRRLRFPEHLDNRHMKVVRLSALHTGRLYPQVSSLVIISVRGWVDPRTIVRPEGLSHLNISKDPTGNRTRDLPAFSAVPQPTALPRSCSMRTDRQTIWRWQSLFAILRTRLKLHSGRDACSLVGGYEYPEVVAPGSSVMLAMIEQGYTPSQPSEFSLYIIFALWNSNSAHCNCQRQRTRPRPFSCVSQPATRLRFTLRLGKDGCFVVWHSDRHT